MASITIQSEQDQARGWGYRVVVERGGITSEHAVTLAWVDHDYWSGGRCAPSRVVEALLAVLIEHETERRLPDRFDASTCRRWLPRLDAELQSRL